MIRFDGNFDVEISTTPNNGDVLAYDATSGKFKPSPATQGSGGGLTNPLVGPLTIDLPSDGNWIEFRVAGVKVGGFKAHVTSTGEVQITQETKYGPAITVGHNEVARHGYVQFSDTPIEAPRHHVEFFSLTAPGTYGDLWARGSLNLGAREMFYNPDGTLRISADPSGGINVARPRIAENASYFRFWTSNIDYTGLVETARIGLKAGGKPMFNSGGTDGANWLSAP